MPRVSVIVPAYFSQRTLPQSLASLLGQDRPPDEIIVVNSSGDAETPAVVAGFSGVRLIDSTARLFPHAARNRGLSEATGDILVCTDPDCRHDRGWLRVLVEEVESGRPVVGGAMGFWPTGPAVDRLAMAIHLTKFWWCLPGRAAGPAWILPTANLAFTREAWVKTGPFRGDIFCGDAVQSWRFAEVGYQPWFTPRAIVSHQHGESVDAARRQRLSRGVEFGRERAEWERWGLLRRWGEAVALPLRWARVMWAAQRACTAAGWAAEFRHTLWLQSQLQAAWVVGESLGFLGVRSGNSRQESPRDKGKSPRRGARLTP